jgi:hypothetical protein
VDRECTHRKSSSNVNLGNHTKDDQPGQHSGERHNHKSLERANEPGCQHRPQQCYHQLGTPHRGQHETCRQETYPGVERGLTHPAEETHQQHIKVNNEITWPDCTHRQSRNNVNPTGRTQAGQHTGDEQLPAHRRRTTTMRGD